MTFLSLADFDANKAGTIGVIASARATAPDIRAVRTWRHTHLLRLWLIDIPPQVAAVESAEAGMP